MAILRRGLRPRRFDRLRDEAGHPGGAAFRHRGLAGYALRSCMARASSDGTTAIGGCPDRPIDCCRVNSRLRRVPVQGGRDG